MDALQSLADVRAPGKPAHDLLRVLSDICEIYTRGVRVFVEPGPACGCGALGPPESHIWGAGKAGLGVHRHRRA